MRYILVLLTLGACTAAPSATAPAANAARATVVTLEAELAATGHVVLACYAVPSCARAAPKLKIRAAYDAAYTNITAAQQLADLGDSPDLTASVAALVALRQLVSMLPQPI